MNETDKQLVQATWEKVLPISQQAARLFYGKLFELDPRLESLFRGDMTDQGRMLMQMLDLAVRGLDRLDDLVPKVRALGNRHVHYGVRDSDYDTVGEALLWTLGQGLGEAFTADVRSAWMGVYATLASTMKSAAAVAA